MKIMSSRIYSISLAIFAISACSSNPLTVHSIQQTGLTTHTSTAATQHTFYRDKNDRKTLCLSPTPDVAVDEESGTSFTLSILNIGHADNEKSENASQGVEEAGLGGRSVNVLLTREILYRQCEFIANSTLSEQQKQQIFEKTLKVISHINQQSLGDGTKSLAQPIQWYMPENHNEKSELPDCQYDEEGNACQEDDFDCAYLDTSAQNKQCKNPFK